MNIMSHCHHMIHTMASQYATYNVVPSAARMLPMLGSTTGLDSGLLVLKSLVQVQQVLLPDNSNKPRALMCASASQLGTPKPKPSELLNPWVKVPTKPWAFVSTHPHRQLFYQFLNKTHWQGTRAQQVRKTSRYQRGGIVWPAWCCATACWQVDCS